MAGNANYDAVLSTTLANHLPRLVDNIFTARPLVFFLKQAGQIRQVGGGHKIVVPLIYAKNTTVASYNGSDAIAITAQEGISAAEFPWRQAAVSITITGIEEAKNSGEEEIIDLLEAKTMQAEESLIEKMDEWLIDSDGTGNSNKDPFGLPLLVGQNASAVGGIDPSTETWWASRIDSTTEALTIAELATNYNTVSVGNDQPNVILTTQALYEKYESLLQPQLRFQDSNTADAGFQNLLYKGAPVVYDTYVNSGELWMLNTKYLRLVGHRDAWFKPTPFVRPENVDARYAQILCYFNFTVSNRARQAKLANKS